MNIIRAAHLGMCFGVRDAISLAFEESQRQPLTILGDLVHNESVIASLEARGIRTAQEPTQATTPTVMITAHGASQQTRARVRAAGLNLIEATCPLVHLAHQALNRLVLDGYHPVIVGQRQHVEVRGLTEDLDEFDVVLTEEDVRQINARSHYGLVAQTTQPIERVRALALCLRRTFPAAEVKLIDTVCQPTKQRQHAAVELAQQCEVVVVIGGVRSNNTRELVATCRQHCERVFHVQTAADLQPEWVAGARTLGLTAGTSTPDDMIDQVEARLRQWAAASESTPAESGRAPLTVALVK